MIYITGDFHRNIKELVTRLLDNGVYSGDTVIVLGDASINYYLDFYDFFIKHLLNDMNIKFFMIRGNHEERPENISTYKEVDMYGGKVYVEKDYPNLIFAKDGEEYNIDGKSILVIGGAYSLDKEARIKEGCGYFEDELLTEEEKEKIYNKVKGKHYDIVLTHTCPKKYEPTEAFIEGIDDSKVDKSMELFLDKVEENISYDKWYCGHYHIEKEIDNIEFMFKNVKTFSKNKIRKRKQG